MPGDVDTTDASVLADDLQAAKELTKKRLMSLFDAEQFRTGEQPYTADLVDEHDCVIATFDVLFNRNKRKNEAAERPRLLNAGSL